MNFLVDTHLLIWASTDSDKLPQEARELMGDTSNSLWFSAVSIWEVAIKRALQRTNFRVDPGPLRAGLYQMGYDELPIESRNVLLLSGMPLLHADPFDRLLLAQTISEGLILLTSDRDLARYEGPIRFVE
jgi:PIN domain nuclease of toxin-antitoxin system